MKPIDIIISTFYKDSCLDKTLTSLKENIKYPVRVWVLDNKSPRSPNIKEVLLKHKDFITGAWLCDDNYFIATYWWAYKNLVDKDSKYFIMLEADVILPEGKECFISRSMEILNLEPNVGVVSIRTKPHYPDNDLNYMSWYNTAQPYKQYSDVLKTDLILWHHLVIRKDIVDNWVKNENYDYFWTDSVFRTKMIKSGYDCVSLDWDAYHYASGESIYLFPEYKNFLKGLYLFEKKYSFSEKNLEKII